jgi:hypothetical protein
VLLRKSIIQPFCGSTVMHNCHSAKVDVPLTKHENGYAILVGYAYMNIVAHQFPQVQMAFTDRVCQQEIIVPELGEILDVCV